MRLGKELANIKLWDRSRKAATVPVQRAVHYSQKEFSKRLSAHLGIQEVLVLRPGFEPGSVAREATILDRTILPEPELYYSFLIHASDI